MGVRQSLRKHPYERMQAEGVRVPTPAEALRIKAYLLTERKATRDLLDVAALADLLGEETAVDALSYLNLLYAPLGNQTRLTKFAEVCQQEPLDLTQVELRSYKGIVEPYDDWGYVALRYRELAQAVFVREMEGEIPRTLDTFSGLGHDRARTGRNDEQEGGAGAMKPMRATTVPTLLDTVDLLSRGGTEDWKTLYAAAKQDPEIRCSIEEEALPLIDPEIGEARALWRILLAEISK